jgi:hypothetical protein
MSAADVSFDRWSSISAEVGGKGRDALLDRLEAEGIAPVDFELAAVTHLAALAGALAAGDHSLADAHAARCADARATAGEDDAVALDTTQEPAPESARDRTLPFAKVDASRRRPPPATPLLERSGETVAQSVGFAAAPSTPFERAQLEAWTVERYAAFVADRRRGSLGTIAARYGQLTEQQEVALLVHFNHRFRREPGLRDRWERLVAAHEKGS